jgi:hypothetical protein
MSIFSDMAAGARENHAHYFGDDNIILLEPGQQPRTISAVLKKSRTETRTNEHGRENRVTVREARLIDMTEVRHDATLTINSEVWSIDQVLGRQASGLSVMLQRVTQHATNRQGYRGK